MDRRSDMKTKRLEILENSLKKKNADINRRIDEHLEDVRSANGQPLNDKRNGRKTLDRWDRQRRMIRESEKSIEKTKRAIEKEEDKIANVESFDCPPPIKKLIDNGTITQWRKHPRFFFVKGVEKARICYDEKTKKISHRYVQEIPSQEQYAIFRDVYNSLFKEFNI